MAARIQTNGSYRLESHACNDSLEFLCHRSDRTLYASSDAGIVIFLMALFALFLNFNHCYFVGLLCVI